MLNLLACIQLLVHSHTCFAEAHEREGRHDTARCRWIGLEDRAIVVVSLSRLILYESWRSGQASDEGAFLIAVMPHKHTEGGLTAVIPGSQVWSTHSWYVCERGA